MEGVECDGNGGESIGAVGLITYSKNSITLEFTVSCTKSKTVNSATSLKIV
jgi:hypothetical protein